MKLKAIYEYFLLSLLIAVSGLPFFYYNIEYLVIGLALSLLYYLSKFSIEKIDRYFLLTVLLLASWESMQLFYHISFSIRSVAGTLFRLSFAYFTIKTLGNDFLNKYVNIIRFFAIVSLVFYLTHYNFDINRELINWARNIQPLFSIDQIEYSYSPNIIIFNFSGYQEFPPRNSGPFWEPGAYSIYLLLAIILNIFKDRKLIWSRNWIFILALITTFSTAGYIALFTTFILLNTSSSSGKKTFLRSAIYIIFILTVSLNLYRELDFLGRKITKNIELAEETTSSRFGSARADFELIIKQPILGYSRNIGAIYGTTNFDLQTMHRNNGLTKLFVTWGIIAIYILWRIWVSCRIVAYSYAVKNGNIILFAGIILSSFSQNIFQFSFFLGILFWSIPFKAKPKSG